MTMAQCYFFEKRPYLRTLILCSISPAAIYREQVPWLLLTIKAHDGHCCIHDSIFSCC